MGTIIGLNCKVFKRTAASSYSTPTFTAVDAVKDASFEISDNLVDASRRGGNGFRQHEATLRDITVTLSMVKDKDDAMFVELLTAMKQKEGFELVIYDGDSGSGSEGLDAMFKFETFNEDQELEGVLMIEATLKPTPDTDLNPTFISGTLPTSR